MAEKMRVHILAKELNVPSKVIVAKCLAEGLAVKNHMSTLGPGLEATIREWFSEGAHTTVVETAERINLAKARKAVKPRKTKTTKKKAEKAAEAEQPVVAAAEKEARAAVAAKEDEAAVAVAEAPVAPPETAPPPPEEMPVAAPAEPAAPVAPEVPAVAEAEPEEPPTEAPDQAVEAPAEPGAAKVAAEAPEAAPEPEEVKPAGPQHVPIPAKLSGPRVVRYEAPEEYRIPKRGRRAATDVPADEEPGPPGQAAGAPGKPGRGKGRRPAETRTERGGTGRRVARKAAEVGEKLAEWRDQDLAEREQRLRGATGRRMQSRRAAGRKSGQGGAAAAAPPITQAQVAEPIVLRQFCASLGVPFQEIFPILQREHGLLLTINGIISKEVAELVAINFGVELTVVEAKTCLDLLQEEFEKMERKHLQKRPPIVAVLGHVDHGKTSLLDAIRRSRVVNREDGGITQHISSYLFERDDVAVTFLDTPGHEAFTALRARGAQITDVVVLVVAADDGVMPQTAEAINHAKAAGVPIVVALNKIDLGTQNVDKIYGQLTEHGLTPSGDWGGETDVIHTSATTGQGVDGLLEHLSALAEVLEFTADPTVPASGTVVEAESRSGVGAVLKVIVREGTVRVGDILVCGHSFGKVRALPDDRGTPMDEVGPSMPVEIWGMNEVPEAGDHFYQIDTMQRAKEIAEQVKQRRLSGARLAVRKARSLDDLVRRRSDADIPELNVIIRADVDGSVEALKHALGRFPSDEVKLNILHAGVGSVTDSDVHLAKASEAIVVAFRVTTPATTKKLADQEGVDVRQYRVIYNLIDEIKQALEGLLAPDEVVEARGSAEVREIFRISKLGMVAGCFVREGTLALSHFARVVRDGVVVREGCRFDSLRRFKETVKEVRSGFECGVRLESFDDVKEGDVIESYEVVRVARTLD